MHTQAVLFDMDGLMFDTERMADAAWIALGPRFGYQVGPADIAVLRGRNKQSGGEAFRARLGAQVPYEAWWEAAHADLAAQLAQAVPLRPKLLPLLARLKALGLPMAVASSTQRALVERNLEVAGVRDYFSCVLGGDAVTLSKPAPEIYLSAAAALCVPPQRCLVLEDSYNGCRAGHAAGCRVVMVPDLEPPTEEMRAITTAIVPDLLAVTAYL